MGLRKSKDPGVDERSLGGNGDGNQGDMRLIEVCWGGSEQRPLRSTSLSRSIVHEQLCKYGRQSINRSNTTFDVWIQVKREQVAVGARRGDER